MTREEAIKIINCYDIGFYDLSGEKIPADKLAEAFDMAIEALKQVTGKLKKPDDSLLTADPEACKEQKSKLDLISRQAAIDALLGITAMRNTIPLDSAIFNIKKLPSAQPERKPGRWIERESDTEDKENGFETVIVCSCCDFPATTFYSEDCESRTQIRTDFCPNCGAKMDKNEARTTIIPNETTYTSAEAHSYSISVCDSCKYIHVPFTHYPCSNCYDHDKYVEWKDQK